MTIILHGSLILPDQSSNPFFRNLNILQTWKRSGRFINKCIYKWYAYHHLLWKLILSHDAMGKCVSFMNKFLTVTLPQPEVSNAAASLPTVYHRRVFPSLTASSQGIGKRPACQVPIRSVYTSWQESRERACQMPTMFIEETATLKGGSFWESVFPERWENMQRTQQCSQSCSWEENDFWCHNSGWIIRSDLTD